jgi:hypothetical protein
MKTYLFILILFLVSCGRTPKQGLVLSNKSSESIHYVISFKDSLDTEDLYDVDTVGEIYKIDDYMGSGKVKTDTSYKYKILPNVSSQILGGGLLEYGFKGPSAQELINKNGGKVTIYIFTDSFLRDTPKAVIVDKQMYSKRYVYNVNDLEKAGWIIEFYK